MNVYEVTDPRSGVTLELEGDSPPTEAELEQIFAQYSKGAPSPPLMSREQMEGRPLLQAFGQTLAGLIPDPGMIAQVPGAMKDVVQNQLESGDPSVFVAPGVLPAAKALVGGIAQASAEAGEMAKQKGRSGLAQILYRTPIVGPMIAGPAEKIAEGKVQEGVGEGLATAALFAPGMGLTGASRTRLAAPLKKELSRDVLAAARRQGVDMPASALTEAPAAPMAEALGVKGLWGGRLRAHARQAFSRMDEIADELRASTRTSDPKIAGPMVADKVGQYVDEFQRLKDELYSAAEIPKRGVRVIPEQTLAVLDDIISRKRTAKATDLGEWERIRAQVARKPKKTAENFWDDLVGGPTTEAAGPRPLELSAFREVIKEWNARFGKKSGDPVLTGNTASVAKLKATASQEFERLLEARVPESYAPFAEAQSYYGATLNKMKAAIGPVFARFEQKPDLLISHLLNPKTSLANIPRLQEILGAEGMEAVQGVVLGDILMKARSPQTGRLMTGSLNKQLAQWGERLPNILTPGQHGKLKDLATLTGSMRKAEKYVEGSQTAFLGGLGARAASGVALGYLNPAWAVTAIGGEAVITRMLSSPYLRRWLTTGLGPELAKLGAAATGVGASMAAGPGLRPANPPESMSAPRLGGASLLRNFLMSNPGGRLPETSQ